MGSKSRRAALSVRPLPGQRNKPRARPKTPPASDQQLLDTVLNNMSQGVLMFDREARLVFCNQRYVEMYGIPPEAAKPGCTLRSLLEHRTAVEIGCISTGPERSQTIVRPGSRLAKLIGVC